nr:aspartate aminotransferase family protein [Elusimicrobiota bacterium]
TLDLLRQRPPYALLRDRTDALVHGVRERARRHGQDVTVNAVGSMFTVFFTKEPVTDLASAEKSDTKLYARFFHGLLQRGVYFPPAQFEAAFVSAAHSARDIDKTIAAVDRVFREL